MAKASYPTQKEAQDAAEDLSAANQDLQTRLDKNPAGGFDVYGKRPGTAEWWVVGQNEPALEDGLEKVKDSPFADRPVENTSIEVGASGTRYHVLTPMK